MRTFQLHRSAIHSRRRAAASSARPWRPRHGPRQSRAHPARSDHCPDRARHSPSAAAGPAGTRRRGSRSSSPAAPVSNRSRPPNSGARSASDTSIAAPRPASAQPPAPRGRHPPPGLTPPRRGGTRSGCQPRRHSSPAVGFCVQRTQTPSCQLEMQMLQPMHSRMSSSRPS